MAYEPLSGQRLAPGPAWTNYSNVTTFKALEEKASFMEDLFSRLGRGTNSILSGAGWLTEQLGAQDFGAAIQDFAKHGVDYWDANISDEHKERIKQDWLTVNDEGVDFNFERLIGAVAESAPSFVIGMGAGGALAKGMQTFANPLGRSVLVNQINAAKLAGKGTPAWEVGEAAARSLKWVDNAIGIGGFGAGEGIMAGAAVGAEVSDTIKAMDHATLTERSERYRMLYDSYDGEPEDRRQQLAKGALADEASTDAGWASGLATAVLGAPAGAFYGRLLGPSSTRLWKEAEKFKLLRGSRTGAAIEGFVTEAGTEAMQSASEQAFTNWGIRDADETQEIGEGVGEAAIEGGLIGGILGGGVGGLAGNEYTQQAQFDREKETDQRNTDRLIATSLEAIQAHGLGDYAAKILEAQPDRGRLATLSDLTYMAQNGAVRDETLEELFPDLGADAEQNDVEAPAALDVSTESPKTNTSAGSVNESLTVAQTIVPTSGERSASLDARTSFDALESSLQKESDAYADATETEFLNNRKQTRDPLKDAIQDAVNAPVLDPDNASTIVDVALSNGRTDLAEYAVSRAERAVAKMDTTPGVAPESSKYSAIKSDLDARKAAATQQVQKLRDKVDGYRASGAGTGAATAQSGTRFSLRDSDGVASLNGVAEVGEPIGNSVLADAKLFGDGPEALAAVSEGFQGVDRDTQGVVLSRVISALDDKEVVRAVIESVPIDVMNSLIGEKGSADLLRGNKTVLASRLSIPGNKPVPVSVVRVVDALASSLKQGLATGGAKESGLAGAPTLSGEGGSAVGAGKDGWHGAVAGKEVKVNPTPTPKQIEAGNWQKGHVRLKGLEISVENLLGSTRSLAKRAGSIQMQDHYGYIRGFTGADNEKLDVYVKDTDDASIESAPIFAVEQLTPDGKFDEHKVYMGYGSDKEVRASFLAHQQLKPAMRMGPKIRKFDSVAEFKQWAREQEQTHQAKKAGFETMMVDKRLQVRGDLVKARQMMKDVGVPTKGTIKRDERGEYLDVTPAAANAVKNAITGRESKGSRAGMVVDHSKKADGTLLGAPPKYNTERKMAPLRALLKKLALEGEPGRFWYEQSSQDIMDFVGGDKEEADLFAKLLAIYSPQAKVDSNTTFAIKAYYQIKAGLPVQVKTAVQDKKAQAAADGAPLREWMGEKTNNFYVNLMLRIDPKKVADLQGATIDMWMMRAFEYESDAPTATQYHFAEVETNRLARELGWQPQQVQAAIWVAMKARTENKGVKDATEDQSEKAGDMTWVDRVDEETGKTKSVRDFPDDAAAARHRRRWLDNALAHDPTKDDTSAAGFHFGNGLRAHLSQLSWEAVPSTDMTKWSWIHGNMAAKMELQSRMADAIGSRILRIMGLMNSDPVVGMGGWKGAVSPSAQETVVAGSVTYKDSDGKPGPRDVSPQIAERMNAACAIYAYLLKQDGVAWHRPMYDESGLVSNGVHFEFGRSLTAEETLIAYDAVTAELMNTFGVSKDTAQMIAPIPHESGIRFVNFPDGDGGFSIDIAAQQTKIAKDNAAEAAALAARWRARSDKMQASDSATAEQKAKSERLAKQSAEKAKIAEEAVKTAGDKLDHKLFTAAVIRGIKSTDLPDFHDRAFRSVGGFVGNNWKENPDGKELIQRATDAGFGDQFRRAIGELQSKVTEVYEGIANKYGPARAKGELLFRLREEGSAGSDRAAPGGVGAQAQAGGQGVAPPKFTSRKIQKDAVSAVGIHYGKAGLKALDPTMAGTGAAGGERKRFGMGRFGQTSPRVNFYIREPGEAVPPSEAVVGGAESYHVELMNLYDYDADPRGLVEANRRNADALEEAVTDAGFDGILFPKHPQIPVRTAIVFGFKRKIPAVPVPAGEEVLDLRYALKGDRETSAQKPKSPEVKAGLTAKAVQGLVNTLNWAGKDKIRVFDSVADLPLYLQQSIESGAIMAQLRDAGLKTVEEAAAKGVKLDPHAYDKRAQGFYDPASKSAVVIAGNIESPEQAYRTIVEEHLRHEGFRRFFTPAKLDQFLDGIYSALPQEGLRAVAKTYSANLDKPEGRRLAAEEYIAKMKLDQERSPLMARVGDWVRGQLRAMGFKMSYSNRDVIHILQQIEDGVRSGRIASPAWNGVGDDPVAPMYSLSGETDRWYYSAMLRSVETGTGAPKKAGATQWKQWLDGAQRRGEFKQAEREWLGVDEWLDGRSDTTRAELVEFVNQNQVMVDETVLGSGPPELVPMRGNELYEGYDEGWKITAKGVTVHKMRAGSRYFVEEVRNGRTRELLDDGSEQDADAMVRDALEGDEVPGQTEFESYQLPGGQNYRELLLTMPVKDGAIPVPVKHPVQDGYALQYPNGDYVVSVDGGARHERSQDPSLATQWETERYAGIGVSSVSRTTAAAFESSHFSQPNILAHVRFNERVDADGKRVLFVEEVQSDWGQDMRKSKLEVIRQVKSDFDGIVERMKADGVLSVECD